MPSVNAKGMAEMMSLPGYAQMGILAAQKYPKNAPNVFRVPYYSPAIAAFREAYRSSDPHAVLKQAIAEASGKKLEHQRNNLARAINAFSESKQSDRKLTNIRVPRISATLGSVVLRASADIDATDEDGRRVVIFYHCQSLKFDPEAAKRLLEIAHWIYEQSEFDLDPKCFEMLDLASGQLHRGKNIRPATIKNMKVTAKMIETMWDTL